MQMAAIARKAEAAGGRLAASPTRKLKLSQFDYTTGDHVKKPLSERWHVFRDGATVPVQRDLYSACLARCATGDSLDALKCREAFTTAEPLLRRAASSAPRSLLGKVLPAAIGESV
jgi:putative transposase